MTGWLQLTDEQRRQTLTQAQVASGMPVKALEKDWWVTLTLKALFQSDYAPFMVFKGGTSLSKGFNLIQRFSEDIDIALDPAAFQMPYQEDPNKKFVEQLKRKGCNFTSTTLRDRLAAQLAALGVPAGIVTIDPAAVPADRPDTDPQILHVHYPPLYDPNPYITDEVRVEVSVRSFQMPVTERPIRSILSEFFPGPAYPEEPFAVPVMEPRKTFLEKLFLLHEEFGKPDRAKIRHERMSRHPYDLIKAMDTSVAADALADHALYDHLITHRERYSRISWVNYGSLRHDTLSFLPPAEVLEKYAVDYNDMQEHFIHEDTPPSFEEIIRRLKWLQGMVRLKTGPHSLKEIVDIALPAAEKLEEKTVAVDVVVQHVQSDGQFIHYRVMFMRQKSGLIFEAITILP
jgi:hypothetical protein